MEYKIRYESFDQFFRVNSESFKQVQSAKTQLKSPQQLGMSGNAIIESEKLAFHFLNLENLVSDLLFALGASVLDAKHDIKNQMGLAYRDLSGSATERSKLIESDERVIKAHNKYNDLHDLEDYLKNKYSDFEKNHYYYKQLSQGNV